MRVLLEEYITCTYLYLTIRGDKNLVCWTLSKTLLYLNKSFVHFSASHKMRTMFVNIAEKNFLSSTCIISKKKLKAHRNCILMLETALFFSTIWFFDWSIVVQIFGWNRDSWMEMVLERWELPLLPPITH